MPASTLKPSKSRKIQTNSSANRSSLLENLPPAIAEQSTDTKPSRLPSEEEIARRAYALCEQRQQNGQPGDALGDWLRAEQELLAEDRQA